MAALVWIAPEFGALAATHVALQFVDTRRLSPHDQVQRSGACRTQGISLRDNDNPAFSASPSAGDGCAGPLKPSMRLFHASQASLSASLRASVARSAAACTEAP